MTSDGYLIVRVNGKVVQLTRLEGNSYSEVERLMDEYLSSDDAVESAEIRVGTLDQGLYG